MTRNLKRIKSGKGLIAVLLLISLHTKSQDSTLNLSVTDAVEYATKNSKQIRNALLGIELQQQTNREITAAAYPQLNGSVGATYFPNVAVQRFPNFIAAATYGVLVQEGVKAGSGDPVMSPADFGFVEAQFGTKYNASAGLDLSQIVFDGQVFIGLKARKTAIGLATKSAEVTQKQIEANIHKVYYQILAGREQRRTIDANITRFEKLLNDTRVIFENGFAEKLDVNKAEVSLTNLRTEKLKVENSLATAMLGLKLLIGMPAGSRLILTDTLPEEMYSQELLEKDYSYEGRPEYELQLLNKKLNEFNIKRHQLSYLPTVSLSGAYYQIAQRNKFNFFKSGEPWFPSSSVGLRINVPLFDGFAKAARVQTAKIQVEQIQNNIEQLELSIDKEVEESRINMRSAIATMEYLKKNMQLAEQVYDQTKLKYEEGLGSNLEISNAQTELTTAQNNYYAALYEAIIARVNFLQATGKL